MYSMKEVCKQTNLTYETLKFYCNEGLIPNVKRDSRNYRTFDERDIEWIKSLSCLKNCGMSIKEMKHYVSLCLMGQSSIPERKKILEAKKDMLFRQLQKLNDSIEYIDKKQQFYNDIINNKIKYTSNLINVR
ncbi:MULTISPECIES: MerR family transcriptional regulator [unclassified Clostridioides]|uniref:MerR family transcriptional regulator n=1 Tax=unclassified Clostridioides TaxID=2635829 RepID=UPI001D10DE44|nr:MerR family transcriptional regulator [Clostridioides sp. ZZV14-6150]MCC0661588.1 MerR family transcriptional regulator [Clostridioides sp. ZZV14-6154]MCC0668961.1 MerR family transcriptional regulator [Clostridioides sp. ZZV14-6153]MCC0721564.1 MerR family transcriptional regulator [Clostridioides sp. ZZV14-6104]MCC0728129.1 MerR family transcriptional regulator [Clostridioides sp. ZZV14-6045]MCC0731964.1 MerR family transcriptional regulator [Clostridioides sp. ZZV14-6048]MCC0735600.1 Me